MFQEKENNSIFNKKYGIKERRTWTVENNQMTEDHKQQPKF